MAFRLRCTWRHKYRKTFLSFFLSKEGEEASASRHQADRNYNRTRALKDKKKKKRKRSRRVNVSLLDNYRDIEH